MSTTKRCIYFVRANQLFKKTFEVEWEPDSIDWNVRECERVLEENKLPFMETCANVCSSASTYFARGFATCYLKDSKGDTMKSIWQRLDKAVDAEFIPPGAHDLLYITSLDTAQVQFALTHDSFYDTFHNPDKSMTCSAKSLAVLKLLVFQHKADYVEDMNKFLWWYYINCRNPLEYRIEYE